MVYLYSSLVYIHQPRKKKPWFMELSGLNTSPPHAALHPSPSASPQALEESLAGGHGASTPDLGRPPRIRRDPRSDKRGVSWFGDEKWEEKQRFRRCVPNFSKTFEWPQKQKLRRPSAEKGYP